ncbi:MAG: MGMT family protein [Acidobacteria bacterium]|nr:MGMT family protein [Acidobacteriota bacterium]
MHRYGKVKTDLGDFRIAWSPRGITAIRSAAVPRQAFETDYRKRFGTPPVPGNVPGLYNRALRGALRGRKADPVAIDWSGFTRFQEKVSRALLEVPAGEVRSYAWLARRAGNPNAARAVGNAMAQNPIPFLIPCHRIVPASGGIGNYGLGKELKRELLKREGAAHW